MERRSRNTIIIGKGALEIQVLLLVNCLLGIVVMVVIVVVTKAKEISAVLLY